MPFVNPRVPEAKPRVIVEQITDVTWRTQFPIRHVGAEGDVFDVPEGYLTDFASVPRVATPLIPRYGRWTLPAILHDRLLTDYLASGAVTSVEADGLFRRALREQGVPPVKRWLMWTGVRWGAAFNKTRRAGWWQTAPAVLGISALAVVPFVVMSAAILAVLALYGLAEFIVTGGKHAGTLST